MLPVPVIYQERIRWGIPVNGKRVWLPYCWIRVHGGLGTSGEDIFALLDTGAQYLMMPNSVAKNLNIDLYSLPRASVTVASGEEIEMPYTKVDVTINGIRVNVDVMFGVPKTPLIGLEVIYTAMQFGVDEVGWLYRARNFSLLRSLWHFVQALGEQLLLRKKY